MPRARGGGQAQTIATLQEGRNLEACRMVKNYQYGVNPLQMTGQQPGTDTTNGTDSSQVAITKSNPNYTGVQRTMTVLGDNVGGKKEIVMALNHVYNNVNVMLQEIVATVPGWTMDSGQLWILGMLSGCSPDYDLFADAPTKAA